MAVWCSGFKNFFGTFFLIKKKNSLKSLKKGGSGPTKEIKTLFLLPGNKILGFTFILSKKFKFPKLI